MSEDYGRLPRPTRRRELLMTADLIDFLRARLADDERTAQAAAGRSMEWRSAEDRGSVSGGPFAPCDCEEWELPCTLSAHATHTIVYDEGYPHEDEAEHIARHDPARVLREVAAKRAIIELAPYADDLEDRYLLTLAAVYADHLEYRAEWRV